MTGSLTPWWLPVLERALKGALIVSENQQGSRLGACGGSRTHREWIQPAITFEMMAPSSSPSSLGAAHRPAVESVLGFGH